MRSFVTMWLSVLGANLPYSGKTLQTNGLGVNENYVYDSLKRLVGATNPETTSASSPAGQSCAGGTFAVCYTYDADGNLTVKMDNRGAKTTYYYDGLNRVILKSYGSPSGVAYTPQVYYCYDSIQASGCPNTGSVPYSRGRLTAVTNGNSTNLYTNYDALGHILSHQQVTGSQTYSFSYSYNLADALVTEVYPSGRAITNCYDGANRVTQVSAVNCGTTAGSYASGVQYAPQGAAASYTFGNRLARTMSYNPRMQVSGFQDVAASGTAYITASLNWGASTDNGNLVSANYTHLGGVGLTSPLPLPQSYTYDGANRLTSVTDNGNTRGFGYDAFGNMWVSSLGANLPYSGNTLQTNIFNSNNQINDGMTTYDAAGNQTYVNGNGLIYDVEGRQTSVNGLGVNENYVYDGDGRRVEKVGAKSGVTTVFVYDALGRMAAEYSTAAENPNCVTCYLSADHLGTARLVTDQVGNVLARHDYMPFGEEFAAGQDGRGVQWGPGDGINQKFTGKERDRESLLDYFGARYYGWALGRFSSPDPENVSGLDHIDDPQSWNAYSYVRNNPLKLTDPDGRNYTVCDQNGYNCGDLTDKQFAQYLNDNSNIKKDAGGGLTYYNDNGTYQNIGSADYYNEKDVAAANFLTYQVAPIGEGLGNILKFAASFAFPFTNLLVDAALAVDNRANTSNKQAFAPVTRKIAQQMRQRGWTERQIQEALANEPGIPAMGKQGPATRYVNPTTGKSIVVDNATGEVFHVGGSPDFSYSDFDLPHPPEGKNARGNNETCRLSSNSYRPTLFLAQNVLGRRWRFRLPMF